MGSAGDKARNRAYFRDFWPCMVGYDHQRELLLQGLAVGFGVAMVAALTVDFLSVAGLALPAAGWTIFGAGMMGWVAGTGFAHRRG